MNQINFREDWYSGSPTIVQNRHTEQSICKGPLGMLLLSVLYFYFALLSVNYCTNPHENLFGSSTYLSYYLLQISALLSKNCTYY